MKPAVQTGFAPLLYLPQPGSQPMLGHLCSPLILHSQEFKSEPYSLYHSPSLFLLHSQHASFNDSRHHRWHVPSHAVSRDSRQPQPCVLCEYMFPSSFSSCQSQCLMLLWSCDERDNLCGFLQSPCEKPQTHTHTQWGRVGDDMFCRVCCLQFSLL